ncbi:MAG: hypothetical protein Q8O99_07395 [bacterium]|nr:hypothetical protein [bacterium]
MQRRSVLNPWSPTAYLFDDSVGYQAKRLFEVCYAPQLVTAKLHNLTANFGLTATAPLAGCTKTTRPTKITASRGAWQEILQSAVSNVIAPAMACEGSTSCNFLKFTILSLMPSMSNTQAITTLE